MGSTGDRNGQRARCAFASLLLCALAALVLWRPIAGGGSHVLGAWDTISQSSSLTRIASTERVSNPQLSDPGLQMGPWSELAANEISAGRAPLWNPYNGCGIPLLANWQSGVLSPFNLPHYLLPPSAAAVTAAWLELACSALAMFALLRALGRSAHASLFGAVVYAFAGFQLVGLQHPHGGTLAFAPAALACIEKALQRFESDRRIDARMLGGAALAMGFAALAGHPETLAAAAAVVAAWTVVRWLGVRHRAREGAMRLAAALAIAGLASIAIAAVQIAPFVEYLAHGADTVALARGAHLRSADLAFQAAPDLAGSPRHGDVLDPLTPGPSYQDVVAHFVGPLAVLLSFWAIASASARRAQRFWIVLALLHAALVLDAPWISAALREALLLDVLPALRLHPWAFLSAAVLASAAIDARLERREAPPRRQALVFAALAAAAAALVAARASKLSEVFEVAPRELIERAWPSATAIAVGVALGLVGWIALRSRPKLGAAALIAGQLLGPAWVLGDYVPTVRAEFRAPLTPAIAQLRSRVGDERVLFLTSDDLRPNVNALYRLRTPMSYDAVEVGRLARLRDLAFGRQGYRGMALRASERALALFGVRFVTTRGPWAPIGTELAAPHDSPVELAPLLRADLLQRSAGEGRRETIGAAGLVQRFAVDAPGLDGIVLRVAAPETTSCAIELELRDAKSGGAIAHATANVSELARLCPGEAELALRFEPQPDSDQRVYELSVRASVAGGASLVRFGDPRRARRDEDDATPAIARAAEWRLLSEGAELRGRVLADVSCSASVVPLASIGPQTLHEFRAGRGRAWIVHSAVERLAPEKAFERVWSRDFDPYAEAALETQLSAALESPSETFAERLELAGENAISSRWRASLGAPGLAVFAQTHYPGWRAFVDGRETPLLRANYAFCAVELPRGESLVELRYEPASVRIGAILSVLGLVAALAAMLRPAR